MILVGAILTRAALKGQVLDGQGNFILFPAIAAQATALITGDDTALKAIDAGPAGAGIAIPEAIEVSAIANVPLPGNSDSNNGSFGSGAGNSTLLANTMQLGNAAKGYKMGATGPTLFDCSGLVWRALQKTYPGTWGKTGRFVTANFKSKSRGMVTQVPKASAQIGDIVLWKTHIGIYSGPDLYYSAMSPRSGIGTSKISATLHNEPAPEYFRVNDSKVGTS